MPLNPAYRQVSADKNNDTTAPPVCDLADEVCGGRVVSTREGGYDLTAVAASVAAHVSVLMERGDERYHGDEL